MNDLLPPVSRRSLFRMAAVGSAGAIPFASASAPLRETLSVDATPVSISGVPLRRTKEKRQLSRHRYCNAEGFFESVMAGGYGNRSIQLYMTGVTIQLALSSHLLDVGFDDEWCARHLALDVGKALRYANASGLDHRSADMERLAIALSPYWKWRPPFDGDRPHCPYSGASACSLTRALLNDVREVTGHPSRPRRRR